MEDATPTQLPHSYQNNILDLYEITCELVSIFSNTTSVPSNMTIWTNRTSCRDKLSGNPRSSNVVDHLTDYPDLLTNNTIRYALIVIHIVGTILAAAGNAVVLVVIGRRKSLRQSPAVLFIFNLAMCDLVSCLLYRPVLVSDFFLPFTAHSVYPHHFTVCQIVTFLQALFMAVMFHTMVAISQERLCLIVFPLKAKRIFSPSRTKKVVLGIWIVGVLWTLPFPLKYLKMLVVDVHVNGEEKPTQIAYCGVFVTDPGGITYLSLIVVVYFALPLLILTVTYTKIFVALYRPAKRLATTHEQGLYRKLLITRRKLAKMMMAVSLLFALCWTPHFSFFYHMAIGRPVPSNAILIASIIEVLPLISATFNPFIYTLTSRTFRTGFKNLFKPKRSTRLSAESAYRTFQSPSNPFRRRGSGTNYTARSLRRLSAFPDEKVISPIAMHNMRKDSTR